MLFLCLELADLVVCVNNCKRLDEESRTGCGCIVNKTLDIILALRLYGNYKAPVTDGDDVLLQALRVCARGVFRKNIAHLCGGLTDLAADIVKLGRGFVSHRFLAYDSGSDLVLELFVGDKTFKDLVKHGLETAVCAAVIEKHAACAEDVGHVKQLALCQHRALFGTLAMGSYILDSAECGLSLLCRKSFCVGSPSLHIEHADEIGFGHKLKCRGARALGTCTVAEHLPDLIKFK